jgi:hypothetical protein
VKTLLRTVRARTIELPRRLGNPARGSPEWLTKTEIRYGGMVSGIRPRRVSPLDDRTPEQMLNGGMRGGDRMLHHGYAGIYAKYLAPFLGRKRLTIAEIGILNGTGLAIWCDLFPDARVIGFDIDLSHFAGNRAALVRRGALQRNQPEVYEFDQFVDNRELLAKILNGQTLDIVIDDGYHAPKAIIPTWHSVRPHLSRPFVYFIEDYAGLLEECGQEFVGFASWGQGLMTVLGPPAEAFERTAQETRI